MKTLVLITILAGVACASAPAAAESDGFYGLISISDSETDFRIDAVNFIDGDDTAGQFSLGYAFNQNWAVEIGYHDFGSPTGFAGCPEGLACFAPFATEPVEVSGWSGQFAGTLPLGMDLSLVGKAGLIAWEADARSAVLRDDGDDLIFSIGLAWEPLERFGFLVSYEKVDLDITSTKLGVLLRF